jgi:hypothetical protein
VREAVSEMSAAEEGRLERARKPSSIALACISDFTEEW